MSRRTEAAFWMMGLLAVAVADPTAPGLLSLCPFDAIGQWLGTAFCPGCGLGHAVGFLARGELAASWDAHPLALPAVAVLSFRIVDLIRNPSRPNTHV